MTLTMVRKKPQPVVACAIGIRVHSGWGALVAVSGKAGAEMVQDRRRIEIMDPQIAGAAQPYHFVEKMDIRAAEKHLATCAAMASRLAQDGLHKVADALRDRGWHVTAAAILLSSGRALPDLPGILASHALIHAAEGDFFRQAFRDACQNLRIPVTGIREKELDDHAARVFGKTALGLRERISGLGRTLGPPWTTDEKTAALAAVIVLSSN